MLTYEHIRELEMGEKESTELQQLPEHFLSDLAKYRKMKKGTEDEKFIKSAVERLLNKREEKLLKLAIYASRAKVQVKNLLPQEKEIFEKIVSHLKELRKKLDEVEPTVEKPKPKKQPEIGHIFAVKTSLPTFMGPDMKKYSLKKGDIVNLPKSLNDLLVRKGIIEKVIINENSKNPEQVL